MSEWIHGIMVDGWICKLNLSYISLTTQIQRERETGRQTDKQTGKERRKNNINKIKQRDLDIY